MSLTYDGVYGVYGVNYFLFFLFTAFKKNDYPKQTNTNFMVDFVFIFFSPIPNFFVGFWRENQIPICISDEEH